MESLYSQLREAIKDSGYSQAELARRTGVQQASISRFIKETQGLSAENAISLANFLGGRFSFPAKDGTTATIRRAGTHSPEEYVAGESLPRIPVMGATGAGDEVEIFEATPSHWITVLPQYVHPQLIGLVVVGDSMEPTIRKGAVVGIVPCDGSLTEGGIYLVHRPPFGLTIKRVQMGKGQQICLHSDNPAYSPMEVPFEGYTDILKGRVVWIWQEC